MTHKHERPDIVVFGARSGVGLEFVKIAKAAGRTVVAVVRPDSEISELQALDVVVRHADIFQAVELDMALSVVRPGWSAVSTLGRTRRDEPSVDHVGNATVIDRALALGASRFLLVSSLGCGDSRQFASERLLAAIGTTLQEKTMAEEYLQSSGLPFTIIRPGGLTNDPSTGDGALYESPAVHGRIGRQDLAIKMWKCFQTDKTLGKTFSAVDRRHLRAPDGTPEYL